MEIKKLVEELKEKMGRVGGLKAIYFVGCGGSMAAIYPAKYLIQSEAKNIATAIYTSNEFIYAMPKSLDNRCLCVICSLKATEETVKAVQAANENGAVTIAMTGFSDTLMAKTGQYSIIYSNGDEQIYSQSNQSLALRFAFEILHQFEDYQYYEAAMSAYSKIDSIIVNAKRTLKGSAEKFARQYKDNDIFYILGSGPLTGTAYTMAACHFMEMQWNHAIMLHAGEYFHGPFETTQQDTAVVLLKSFGRTRPMDERAENFLKKKSKHYFVIDAKDAGIDQIDEHIAEFFNSVIMIPLERYFVSTLAETRNRTMDERRYMWKEAY